MPTYEGSHVEAVAASCERCFELLTDLERMPEWQGPLARCEALERDRLGYPTVVAYEISTPVRNVSYTLRHTFDAPSRITGELIEGQVESLVGNWSFAPDGGEGCRAEFELRIDPGRWVPGKIARMLHETVMKRSVADLKRAAEAA